MMHRLLLNPAPAARSIARRRNHHQLWLLLPTATTPALPMPIITAFSSSFLVCSNAKVHHNNNIASSLSSYTTTTRSCNTASSKKDVGLFTKVKHMIRTIFGTNDDTPRAKQERQDLLWIILSCTHRNLRIKHQHKLLLCDHQQQDEKDENSIYSKQQEQRPITWQEESQQTLKELLDQAVAQLDDSATQYNSNMKLNKLRNEVQTNMIQPQITQLLHAVHDVEEELKGYDVTVDEYVFEPEVEEYYRDIILNEYEYVCQQLKSFNELEEVDDDNSVTMNKSTIITNKRRRTGDPLPFYNMKKNAIETLLTYYNWWPKGSSIIRPSSSKNTNENDEEEYMDEFGFQINKSNNDTELISAMRYYHVRNLVRACLVKKKDQNQSQPSYNNCYHSLHSLKSTIPNANRGVYIDGYAPAGTLLTLMPGKVWPRDHLQNISLNTQVSLSQDPRHQLSMRYDDILIDSRNSPYTVVTNCWALGHVVNHPPKPSSSLLLQKQQQQQQQKQESGTESSSNKKSDDNNESTENNNNDDESNDNTNISISHQEGPNCILVLLDYTDKMINNDKQEQQRTNLKEYIPNEYEIPPKPSPFTNPNDNDDTIIMHGMGLISIRDVKDEELFYDYRLSPDNDNDKTNNSNDGDKKKSKKYPSWYHVWDEESIHNRWD